MVQRRIIALTLACLSLILGGCFTAHQAKSDKEQMTTKGKMTITATADVNPASDGRPSPIVLRVYQLKDRTRFLNSDFFPLFDSEQQSLGGDLLSREEFELTPGESHKLDYSVLSDTKYLAVLAAYRDIRNSQWRVVRALPDKGLITLVKNKSINVSAARTAVTLTISE